MTFLKYFLAFVVLSIVIFIHEFGHFIIAKASGVVVEEFSIGMGPRLFKFTRKGTMYSLKLFFFGGSCRMKGEDDPEAEDTEGSFQSASWGRRFAIIAAGPLFNFLLAFVLSIILIGKAGYDPCIVYRVTEDSAAEEAGLMAGDTILKMDKTSTVFYGDYSMFVYALDAEDGDELTLTVKRDGEKLTLTYPITYVDKDVYQMGVYLYSDEPVIASVVEDTPAEEAGLCAEDRVLSVDGTEVETSSDISALVQECNGNAITLVILRGEEELTLTFTPTLAHTSYYDLGFTLSGERIMVSPLKTVGYAFEEVGYWIRSVFTSFKLMFAGKVSANDVSGPVGIVSAIGDVVEEAAEDGGLYVFLNLLNWCVMISANLGVMNLLPIPALDGGRLLFLLVELVFRKPVPKDKEAIVNVVGFILLMVLMVVIMFNDIRKLIFGI